MRQHERQHLVGTRAAVIAATVVAIGLGFAWFQDRGPLYAEAPSDQAALAAPMERTGSVWQRAPLRDASLRDCSDCPPMVRLPEGRFVMGLRQDSYQSLGLAPRQAALELPLHWQDVAAVALGSGEVTQAEFTAFAKATGADPQGCEIVNGATGMPVFDPKASWRHPGFDQAANNPVVCVSWQDAQAYAEWLSQRTGHAYRLPREAEWEWAARAGTNGAWFWYTAQQTCRYANVAASVAPHPGADLFPCKDSYPFTAPVDALAVNPAGLRHMLGNAAEWTADCLTRGYGGAPVATGQTCNERAVRGGSWHDGPSMVRSAARTGVAPTVRSNRIGFRVARELP